MRKDQPLKEQPSRQGWSHRLWVKVGFVALEEEEKQKAAGSSQRTKRATVDPGRNKPELRDIGKGVVAGKVEKPWAHPAVWRMSVPRGDPVPAVSFATRKQAEHVVHTTRTGQNSGLKGGEFCPCGGYATISVNTLLSQPDVGLLLASSGWRPGLLLITLQCTGRSPQGRMITPNVNRAEVEKPEYRMIGEKQQVDIREEKV